MAAVSAVATAETQVMSNVQQVLQQVVDSGSTASDSAVINMLGDSVTRMKDIYTPVDRSKSPIYTMLDLHNKSKAK